jgi:uncharacterized protein (TIGR02271 family)
MKGIFMESTHSYAYDEKDASPYDRGTLAAIFDTPDQAKQALKDLHEADFKKTWMGVTASLAGTPSGLYEPASDPFTADRTADGDIIVETVEGGGFGGALSRFFGEFDQQSLHDALIHQGIPASDAVALEAKMHDGGAVITVQVHDRYDEALLILRQDRGTVASADTASTFTAGPASTLTVAPASRSAVAPASPFTAAPARAQADDVAAPTTSTDDETVTLSEERLLVDKQRVAAGAATIGKQVVSEQESVDVPVMHEELFIQRRPVAPGGSPTASTIGAGETYRIPLMRDQVVVDKRTFVTEEVDIGKRAVAGTQRVSDTVRHEELVVDESGERVPADPLSRV